MIISTYILEEVHAICNRAIIIADGRIVADGTPEELEARSRYHRSIHLHLADECAAGIELAALPSIEYCGSY